MPPAEIWVYGDHYSFCRGNVQWLVWQSLTEKKYISSMVQWSLISPGEKCISAKNVQLFVWWSLIKMIAEAMCGSWSGGVS